MKQEELRNIIRSEIQNVVKEGELEDYKLPAQAERYLNKAVDAIKGETIKPNLIFLDINMPAMNGWEFIEEFKKLDPVFTEDIKIVLLTTSNNPEDFERSKQIELVSEYINKPLSKEILEDLTTKINIKPKVTKHK